MYKLSILGSYLIFVLTSFTFGQQIDLFAGNSQLGGYVSDGQTAFGADLDIKEFIKYNEDTALFWCAQGNVMLLRTIDLNTGIVNTVAGDLLQGTNYGDGGSALLADGFVPKGTTVDKNGDIYFLDGQLTTNNWVIRKIDVSTGIITTILDQNSNYVLSRNGNAIVVDENLDIYYDRKFPNHILKVNQTTGIVETVAGTGTNGFSGDGGPANNAQISDVEGMVIDSLGNLYFTDWGNHRIRRIDNSGIITTVAGNGNQIISCDGCDPLTTGLSFPHYLSIDKRQNLYFTEYFGSIIKKISVCDGNLYTIAGNGTTGNYSGDGGLPLNAEIDNDGQFMVNDFGLFFTQVNRVRRVVNEHFYQDYAGSDVIVCENELITLNCVSPATTINWTNGVTDGVPFIPIDSTNYRVEGFDATGCHMFTDNVFVQVLDIPLIDTFTDGILCGEGYVDMAATSTAGSTVEWFDAETGGAVLAVNNSFTSNYLAQTDSFYVQANNQYCVSPTRTKIMAFITPPGYCTYIPDDGFEMRLITYYGVDDQLNDYVLTSSIDTMRFLGLPPGGQVSDLTGIEDFIALEEFTCTNCQYPGIQSVDFSNNLQLRYLDLSCNELTEIDLQNNILLKTLKIRKNNLSYLDLSNQPIEYLDAAENDLSCLNLKNGFSTAIQYLDLYLNTKLSCVQVDNEYNMCGQVNWGVGNLNWNLQTTQVQAYTWYDFANDRECRTFLSDCGTNCDTSFVEFGCQDPQATNFNILANYPAPCEYVGLDDLSLGVIGVSPNPTLNNLKVEINNILLFEKYKIYDSKGQVLLSGICEEGGFELDLSDLEPGYYILRVGALKAKFIKQ